MFSIIIPLYNKELFIKRCVDSVLSQTYVDYELIIVDDGSTDGSLSVVSSYDDARIKIITQKNKGKGAARNRGVLESSNEWIALVDADDVWGNYHLEELKLLIEDFEDAGIVSTRSTELAAGQIPATQINGLNWKRKRVDYFREAGLTKGLLNSSSVAIRHIVFDKIGYFKNILQGEDTEFWCRVCLVYPCAVSEKPTSFYCRGTDGIMEKNWKQNIKKQSLIKSIKEIGPAVSYLVDELETGNLSGQLKESVIVFINSRINTALSIILYNGRFEGMSLIGDFYLDPLLYRCQIWKILSKQPRWLVMCLYKIRSVVRMVYRIVKKIFEYSYEITFDSKSHVVDE